MPSIIPKITINGKESTEISGLMIVSLPPITKPAMRAVAEEIDGRDGDQIEKLGFSAYDKTIKIALSGDYDVDDVIEYFNQDGIIIFSNEPDKYYHFKQLEGIDFEKLMRYKTADVVFHCQPFKFSTTEEEQIFSNPESVNITNSGNYFSKPEIVLTGKGNMEMSINDAPVLDIDFGDEEQTIAIDAQSMNAYGTKNNIKEAIFEINPSQDLHGYESAWLDSETPFKKPYNFINVAGTASRIGNSMIDKIVGGSFAFNQRIAIPQSDASTTLNQVAMTDNRDGTYTLNGTADADCIFTIVSQKTWQAHKYILMGGASGGSTTKYSLAMRGAGSDSFDFGNGTIWNADGNTWKGIVIYFKNGQTASNLVFKPQLIDLTQMLGSTIADYIYSLEQATAGAGVAYFRALFPDDYYPYNVGELLSVKTSAHIMRNASNAILANYPLDANLELRGIPQIDANGNLSYDGDEYTADGNVLRRYGIVDLGSLNWSYIGGSYNEFSTTEAISGIKTQMAYNPKAVISAKYTVVAWHPENEKTAYFNNNGFLYIMDNSYSDATAFKASLSGVYLIFEKATATTETAQPFASPQIVDASGSMEYVDARAVKIPVGHVSMYANNCEILGFTESNVSKANKNLFDDDFSHYRKPVNYYVCDIPLEIGKTIPVAWAVNQWDEEWEMINNRLTSKNYIPVMPATEYFFVNINLYGVYMYDSEFNYIGKPSYSGRTGGYLFITAKNCHFIKFDVGSPYGSTYNNDISVNYPSTDHNYHAYSGIPTAYKAQLIFLDGTWELRLLSKKINMGSLSWEKFDVAQGSLFRSNEIDVKKIQSSTEIPNVLCGLYPTVANAERVNHSLSMVNNTAKIDVIDDGFDDVASFKTAMKNIDLEYEMQSPVSISLSADELTSLLGINNIWHDANGETQIRYTKDGDVEHETSGMIATFYIDVDDIVFGVFKNRLIIGDYDKIQLKKGSNTISFAPIDEGSEISNMAIDFYSRWL